MKTVFRWSLVCTFAAVPLAASAQEQSSGQQRCVVRLLRDALGVAQVQGRKNAPCVRGAGAGTVVSLTDCLEDNDGRLAEALARTTADALALCAESPPDFGLPAAFETTLTDAAIVHARGVLTDLFGDDPDAAIVPASEDAAGAECQTQVVKRTDAIMAARAKGFLGCVRSVLKKRAANGGALAGCVRGEARGSVKKAASRLRGDVKRRCRGIDPSAAFPGRCGETSTGEFADCVTERTACRACRLAATSAAIDVDCDLIDDGEVNQSCSFPVSLSGDAIPFIGSPVGRIPGATITIVEQPQRQFVTAANGAFLFEDLEEGSEVTLELAHPEYHPIQTGTIRLGASGVTRVTFQAVTYEIYNALAALLQVVPDEANRCQMVTTVTRVGKSIYDAGAHGEGDATVTLTPPLPAEHGPIYFNASVLPDRTLVETSGDGGVLFIQVPPGEYVWTARKPDVLISRIKMKCRAGFLVNASPPWGLQTH